MFMPGRCLTTEPQPSPQGSIRSYLVLSRVFFSFFLPETQSPDYFKSKKHADSTHNEVGSFSNSTFLPGKFHGARG